jgi:hypothetical protein
MKKAARAASFIEDQFADPCLCEKFHIGGQHIDLGRCQLAFLGRHLVHLAVGDHVHDGRSPQPCSQMSSVRLGAPSMGCPCRPCRGRLPPGHELGLASEALTES